MSKMFIRSMSANCLNSSYTCTYTALFCDDKRADNRRIVDMHTAAKLDTCIAKTDNANLIAVLLAKLSFCTGFFCLFYTHNLCISASSTHNFIIHSCLNLNKLCMRECLWVREVKS